MINYVKDKGYLLMKTTDTIYRVTSSPSIISNKVGIIFTV